MRRRSFLISVAAFVACVSPAFSQIAAPDAEDTKKSKPSQTVYDFSLVDLDGKIVPLSTYKGKLLLIVNLASQSIYNNQVAALNDLQKTYSSAGLVILGIPSSDFGGEELKDAAALRKYYTETEHPAFAVFARASLHGSETIPLYSFLCDPNEGLPGGEIHWNFSKFLIDRQGKPMARYEVGEDPADIDFHVTIEEALAGKLKKQDKDSGEKADKAADPDDDDRN